MATRSIGIIMHGVTGRIGTVQHLQNAISEIRREGGVPLADGTRLMPEPVLVGRNADKLAALAGRFGLERWTTDLDAALADPENAIFFDSAATAQRPGLVRRAVAAGKHVYVEKPIAGSTEEALELARAAQTAGLKHGVVQDKMTLPGLVKLALLRDLGFFGRILHVRLDFGWWVFDGLHQPAQRSSWNYRKAEGGGLILDMYPHWRYILDGLFGPITAVTCRHQTQLPDRRDEAGRPYVCDVEDAAYATFELASGVLVEVTSSWTSRVRRDDLLTLQVDGTGGSAVAGLHRCFVQPAGTTPLPAWDVMQDRKPDYPGQWQEVPDTVPLKNGYRAGWEGFLAHVAEDAPFAATLLAGARGVQLAEAAYRSNAERRWVELPELTL